MVIKQDRMLDVLLIIPLYENHIKQGGAKLKT